RSRSHRRCLPADGRPGAGGPQHHRHRPQVFGRAAAGALCPGDTDDSRAGPQHAAGCAAGGLAGAAACDGAAGVAARHGPVTVLDGWRRAAGVRTPDASRASELTVDLGPVGVWTFHLDLQPVPRARELVAELEAM